MSFYFYKIQIQSVVALAITILMDLEPRRAKWNLVADS